MLGELEVVNDEGQPVPLRAGKLRVILATLLLRANRTVQLDELIDRLWGDQAPKRARNTAQTYVTRLRHALRDCHEIHTRPGGYLIRIAPDQLDLLRFRALVHEAGRPDPADAAAKLHEALRLWRGAALADVPSDSLKRDEIPRLTEERLRCLERRIELDLELGRHHELVAELSALTTEHLLRERFWGQLMLALYRSGRQAEALHRYRELRGLLVAELGIEPGAELQRLHEAILRGDPRLGPATGTAWPAPSHEPASVPADPEHCPPWRAGPPWVAWSGRCGRGFRGASWRSAALPDQRVR